MTHFLGDGSWQRLVNLTLMLTYLWFWAFNYLRRRSGFTRHQRRVSLALLAFFVVISDGIIKAYRFDLPVTYTTYTTMLTLAAMVTGFIVRLVGDDDPRPAPWQDALLDRARRLRHR